MYLSTLIFWSYFPFVRELFILPLSFIFLNFRSIKSKRRSMYNSSFKHAYHDNCIFDVASVSCNAAREYIVSTYYTRAASHWKSRCAREVCKFYELVPRIVFGVVSTEVANVICSRNSRATANCLSNSSKKPDAYFEGNLDKTFVIILFSNLK